MLLTPRDVCPERVPTGVKLERISADLTEVLRSGVAVRPQLYSHGCGTHPTGLPPRAAAETALLRLGRLGGVGSCNTPPHSLHIIGRLLRCDRRTIRSTSAIVDASRDLPLYSQLQETVRHSLPVQYTDDASTCITFCKKTKIYNF